MKKEMDYNDEENYQDTINDDLRENNLNHIKFIMILIIITIVAALIVIINEVTNTMQVGSNPVESQIIQIEEEQIRIGDEEKRKQKEQEELAKQEELARQEELAKQEELRKQQEEREAKFPKLTEVGRANMENIYHSETKRAFLTFDDGPSNVTPQILDVLKNEDIKATFFMLGSNVVNFPETTKRVWNEGHFIANHGYTHVYSSIYSSTQAVLDEYNMCNDAIRNALGEPEYNSHLFRFPGGLEGGKYADLKQEANQLLSDNDILSIDWNALTGDAETQHPVAEKLMERLKETTEGKNSVVILMHDAQAKKVTADMLPDIIGYLREQGYEFKTFYDIIK